MNKKQIINQTIEYVKAKMTGEGSGHDWWHVYRVWKNAIHIAKYENADMFVVELAAILHDIGGWNFLDGKDDTGPEIAKKWLKKLSTDEKIISHVFQIIKDMPFKCAGITSNMKSIEGKIIQDADRLDAIGAIGIARGFVFAGNKSLPLYDPSIKPIKINDPKIFRNIKRPTYTQINHFYEKLLLLKDLMNTAEGKRIAKKRHKFMEVYLEEFFREWEGKD